MKKFLLILACVLCMACTRITETQYGRIVAVEYHQAYSTTQLVPIHCGKVTTIHTRRIYHPESWETTICYNDSIYDHHSFDHEVHIGDSISREVTIGYKSIFD